jgi:uncharacterized protein (TIGR02147 family)
MSDPQGRMRDLMIAELERSQSHNPRYSLRAFAKKLSLSPSQASELLSGKRMFTKALAKRVLGLLDDVDEKEAETLVASCSIERRGRRPEPSADSVDQKTFQELNVDQFRLMGDWRSFAVLSLSETWSFREDPAWIGKTLGIHPKQAQQILERLERLGALKRDASGTLKHAGIQFASTTHLPSLAIRRAHRERLELARQSLDQDAIGERDITGITMSVDPSRIPEAKERIRCFRRELCAFLEAGDKQRVFHLAVQLFPLSRKENES